MHVEVETAAVKHLCLAPSSLSATLDIMAALFITKENFQLLALRRAPPRRLKLQRKHPAEHAQISSSIWHIMKKKCHMKPAIPSAMHVEVETVAAKHSRLPPSSWRATLDIMVASLITKENFQLLALHHTLRQQLLCKMRIVLAFLLSIWAVSH